MFPRETLGALERFAPSPTSAGGPIPEEDGDDGDDADTCTCGHPREDHEARRGEVSDVYGECLSTDERDSLPCHCPLYEWSGVDGRPVPTKADAAGPPATSDGVCSSCGNPAHTALCPEPARCVSCGREVPPALRTLHPSASWLCGRCAWKRGEDVVHIEAWRPREAPGFPVADVLELRNALSVISINAENLFALVDAALLADDFRRRAKLREQADTVAREIKEAVQRIARAARDVDAGDPAPRKKRAHARCVWPCSIAESEYGSGGVCEEHGDCPWTHVTEDAFGGPHELIVPSRLRWKRG